MELSEIELLFDRILILPDKPVQSDSKLFEGDIKPPNTGTIVAVGKGKQAEENAAWIEMQVREGDRVVYDRFNAFPFMETEYLLTEQGFAISKIKIKL